MGLKFSENLSNMLHTGNLTFSLNRDMSNNYFTMPTTDNLNCSPSVERTVDDTTVEKVKEFVSQHTSGVKGNYDFSDEGSMIVNFTKFIEMVNNGYNIYESEVISKDLINIRFQKEINRGGKARL